MVNRLRKVLVVIAVATGLVALVSGPALAQNYQGGATLTCTPATAGPGDTVTCTVTGFQPGSTVTFSVAGNAVASATVDDAGSATASFALPADASGDVVVSASGVGADGQPLELTTTVVVGASSAAGGAPQAPSSSGLPATGSNSSATLVRVAVGLVALGGVALLVSRRRVPAGESV